ncbi:hypothetical protein M758_1G282900 [Ceratodon purpureus]|nr:hypothetical protein M758_1G282900 [Ceratodon purpureus]
MPELKPYAWATLASMCLAVTMLWRVYQNPALIGHNHFFDPSPGPNTSSGLELWRNVSPARWKPCSWWSNYTADPAAATTEKTNGYIIIACSGGLNQMRRDFCKGVEIARLLNATLLLPRFEASPYWNDTSGFPDIFDVEFFLESVHGWVDVLRELPAALSSREPVAVTCHKVSGRFDYVESLLPQLLEHEVILLQPSATQRTDRDPDFARRARCHACYRSLRLVGRLQEIAEAILRRLPRPFVALHLRFEPDMVAYSRCRYNNLSNASMASIERVRGSRQVLGEEVEKLWRRKGKCPLTAQETAFILTALNVPASTTIYLAAGAELLEAPKLTATYSHVFQKSDFFSYVGHLEGLKGSSRAAVDWMVSLHAVVYIATFVGNMDKMVVADRMLAGQHRNLVLDRHAFAEAKWQGMQETELSKLMLTKHRQHVTSGFGLPVPDCFCKA